jgi:hypothetical protein
VRYTRTGEWSALLSAQHDAIAHRYGDIRLDPFARGLRMPGQAGEGAERAESSDAQGVSGAAARRAGHQNFSENLRPTNRPTRALTKYETYVQLPANANLSVGMGNG